MYYLKSVVVLFYHIQLRNNLKKTPQESSRKKCLSVPYTRFMGLCSLLAKRTSLSKLSTINEPLTHYQTRNHLLPLINNLFDKLVSWILRNINLIKIYNQVHIASRDVSVTVYCMRYGSFKFRVMCFLWSKRFHYLFIFNQNFKNLVISIIIFIWMTLLSS